MIFAVCMCSYYFLYISVKKRYLSATLCPSSTLISWEYLVMSGGSQRNSSSGMDQKYLPERCCGEAHVSRSSSLFSRRSHSSSQLQWRGFPPNDSAKEEEVRTPDVARTWLCETDKQREGEKYICFNLWPAASQNWMSNCMNPHG